MATVSKRLKAIVNKRLKAIVNKRLTATVNKRLTATVSKRLKITVLSVIYNTLHAPTCRVVNLVWFDISHYADCSHHQLHPSRRVLHRLDDGDVRWLESLQRCESCLQGRDGLS